MWRAFFAMFLMTSVIVLLLSFVASAWVSMRQSRPIREMAAATRAFAEGNFDTRMHDYGAGEIGELASAFNAMADSLQETERQRREFIANISHELKTPMTSIAGYTDGILDGTIPPEKEKEYLHIISDEGQAAEPPRASDARGLAAPVARRDAQQGALRRVREHAAGAYYQWKRRSPTAGWTWRPIIPDEPVTVLGDNDLITQVIYNLLENATKFARAGSTLYLGLAVTNGRAVVSVRNEGDTIPPRRSRCSSSASTRATSPAARIRTAWASGSTSSRPFWSSTTSTSPSRAKTA